jgi:hypothetical protein
MALWSVFRVAIVSAASNRCESVEVKKNERYIITT